jgi:DNA polymerase
VSAAALLSAIWKSGGNLRLCDDGRLLVRAPATLRPDIAAQKRALIALLEAASVYFDIETRSASDLKTDGPFVYARHSTTQILMASTALGDAEPELWLPGMPVPRAILELPQRPGWRLVVHNDGFERAHEELLAEHGWPHIPIAQRRCTMAACRMQALPGSLEKAGKILGIANGKDAAAGRRLIAKFSIPQNRAGVKKRGEAPIFIKPADAPGDFAAFADYNRGDVAAHRELDARVPPLSAFEQRVWEVDARVNDRGMRIDRDLAAAARKVATAMVAELDAELAGVTAGAVTRATQVQRLQKWCLDQGYSVASLQSDAIEDMLEQTLSNSVHRALEIRLEAGKASPRKLDKMLSWSAVDGRAHGCLTYCGAARTSRWSGAGFQPQNLRRPVLLDSQDIGPAIAAVSSGDLELVRAQYGRPIDVVGDLTRSIICAEPGRVLMGADFGQIEARLLAALAGETWKLREFRACDEDPTRPDIYVQTAAAVLRIPVEKVDKKLRQTPGKICELAFGYGGALGSFRSFHGRKSRETYTDDEIQQFKYMWRQKNWRIVMFWEALFNAAVRATEAPGRRTTAGQHISFVREDDCLYCRLPSGRRLRYPRPRIDSDGDREEFLFTEAGRTQPSRVYGGKFAAHVTSATARDLLAAAMVRIDAMGLPIIHHAHDEVLVEVLEREADLGAFVAVMTEVPEWAMALAAPIVADGWVGVRYRK